MGEEDPTARWRHPVFYVATCDHLQGGEVSYVGYCTDFVARRAQHMDKNHPDCPAILKGRCGEIKYQVHELVHWKEHEDNDARRQAKTRELVHSSQLIGSNVHKLQRVNGAMWCLFNTVFNDKLKGNVLRRVQAELSRAKEFFKDLPEDAAFAGVESDTWRAVQNAVLEFSQECPAVAQWLEYVPRSEASRTRKRRRPEQ